MFFLERAPFFVPPTQLQRSSQFFCVDVPLHTSVPLSCAATAVVPKKRNPHNWRSELNAQNRPSVAQEEGKRKKLVFNLTQKVTNWTTCDRLFGTKRIIVSIEGYNRSSPLELIFQNCRRLKGYIFHGILFTLELNYICLYHFYFKKINLVHPMLCFIYGWILQSRHKLSFAS